MRPSRSLGNRQQRETLVVTCVARPYPSITHAACRGASLLSGKALHEPALALSTELSMGALANPGALHPLKALLLFARESPGLLTAATLLACLLVIAPALVVYFFLHYRDKERRREHALAASESERNSFAQEVHTASLLAARREAYLEAISALHENRLLLMRLPTSSASPDLEAGYGEIASSISRAAVVADGQTASIAYNLSQKLSRVFHSAREKLAPLMAINLALEFHEATRANAEAEIERIHADLTPIDRDARRAESERAVVAKLLQQQAEIVRHHASEYESLAQQRQEASALYFKDISQETAALNDLIEMFVGSIRREFAAPTEKRPQRQRRKYPAADRESNVRDAIGRMKSRLKSRFTGRYPA